MNPHAQKILDKLIRAYEKSAHANPFQPDSNRRILFLMKKYPAYDVRDYGIVEEINEALQALADQNYITIEFDREHANHIKRVALNLKELDTIYRREYGRLPKPERVLQLEQLLCFYHDKVHTAWMQEYLNDEMRYLKKKGTLHEYAGKDAEHIEGLLRVLCFLEENPPVYIRTMSTRLFQNSKYFEQELKSSFLSVLHRYEPGLVQAREEELELADSEVFAYLGFRMYPETFAWKGDVQLVLKNGQCIDTAAYDTGFLLQADMLEQCVRLILPENAALILIENKTTYYQYLPQAKAHEIVLFAQGHFSPKRKELYRKFAQHRRLSVSLWSDIDLGGFLMYARLKKEVFPELQSMHMDVKTFKDYRHLAKPASAEYLKKIEKARMRDDLDVFHAVMDRIIESGSTLEQEAIAIEE